MYGNGTYGYVKLDQPKGTTQCRCGFLGVTSKPRVAQCVCTHTPIYPLVVKISWDYNLYTILKQRRWGLFVKLLDSTEHLHWKQWPGCSKATSIQQALCYATSWISKWTTDVGTYDATPLGSLLHSTYLGGADVEPHFIIKTLYDETSCADKWTSSCEEMCAAPCLEQRLIPAWVRIKEREMQYEHDMALKIARLSPAVGPVVHQSADPLILTMEFAGPTIFNLWDDNQNLCIRTGDLLFAVYIRTEVLRIARLRHNDLSVANVCVEMREEVIRFAGRWWRFPFRVRFIDCGFCRSVDTPAGNDIESADDERVLLPDDVRKLGLCEGMSLHALMAICYARNRKKRPLWPRPGWHFRTIEWLRNHEFIDALQFATMYGGYESRKHREHPTIGVFVDLLTREDFAARSVEERVDAVAACCGQRAYTQPQSEPRKRKNCE